MLSVGYTWESNTFLRLVLTLAVVVLLFYCVFITIWLFYYILHFFFFKQKTAYELRISDWNSDVCSSDLPSVSLLMPTKPGRLTQDQAARLQALRDSSIRRLRQEGVPSADRLLTELNQLITTAEDVTLDRGLALYVNEHHAQLLVLPVEVKERAVVDPTFATRDLVRALHRTPRHVVLVVSAQEARLFDSQLGSLRRADSTKFPMQAGNDKNSRESTEAFWKRVDQALGAHLRLRPAPVVLVAAAPTLSRFTQSSANLSRLAGKIAGNHIPTPLPDLADLVSPRIETYLASRDRKSTRLNSSN